jgi:hypothetical protein
LRKKVWLQQKDFWAMNSKNQLEYYRLDVIDAGVNSICGRLKDLVRAGRIYLVDVEGKREEFFDHLEKRTQR